VQHAKRATRNAPPLWIAGSFQFVTIWTDGVTKRDLLPIANPGGPSRTGRKFGIRGSASPRRKRNSFMWRSFFLAIGAYCCLLGVEALAVEKAVLKADPFSRSQTTREIAPPDWAAWSMLAGGSVVMLYSFTIPQRVNGG
jgi:hypothetical protein